MLRRASSVSVILAILAVLLPLGPAVDAAPSGLFQVVQEHPSGLLRSENGMCFDVVGAVV